MSNFKIGTLVLLYVPEGVWVGKGGIPNGAIGTIVDGSRYHNEIKTGEVAVDFPNNPSDTRSKLWRVPSKYLKPLGGDDLLSDEDKEDSPYNVKAPAVVS